MFNINFSQQTKDRPITRLTNNYLPSYIIIQCYLPTELSKNRDEPINVVVKAIVAGEGHESSTAYTQRKEHLSCRISPYLYDITSLSIISNEKRPMTNEVANL